MLDLLSLQTRENQTVIYCHPLTIVDSDADSKSGPSFRRPKNLKLTSCITPYKSRAFPKPLALGFRCVFLSTRIVKHGKVVVVMRSASSRGFPPHSPHLLARPQTCASVRLHFGYSKWAQTRTSKRTRGFRKRMMRRQWLGPPSFRLPRPKTFVSVRLRLGHGEEAKKKQARKVGDLGKRTMGPQRTGQV